MAAAYEGALFADLGKALAALPHDRIAVQWDVAVEFSLLEGAMDRLCAPARCDHARARALHRAGAG